jgi:hypothetical protein
MSYCHWPQLWISHFRPADALMQHHGASHVCDGTNSAFGSIIGMLGTNTSKAGDFLEILQVASVVAAGKGGSIVTVVRANDHTKVMAAFFKFFLALQHLMSVETGMIIEHTATSVHAV